VDEVGNEVSLYVDAEMYASSIHGEFDCIDCHADIEQIPHEEKLQKVECGACHDDALEAYQTSVHGKAKEEGALDAASCADCHGKHDILPSSNPESKAYPLKVAATCATCHADPKVVKKYKIPISDPLAAYKKSVHGIAVLTERNFHAATCNSCHGSHDIRTMDDPRSPIFWKNVPETCGQCHEEIYQQYTESVHWSAAAHGIKDAPVCTDCHGEHEVKSPQDPESPVHPLRVAAATCEWCHGSELIAQKYGLPEDRVSTFEQSYHGLAIKGGSLAAANCASCHGIHNILPSSDLRSTVNPANLQKTCGHCHQDATKHFAEGPIHLTTNTTPGRVVQYVQKFYIALIVIVIGGMILHNGADFIRRAKKIVQIRK
jgi:nitrate/TMAO reductase-like tetraheme cytochrome c subunit